MASLVVYVRAKFDFRSERNSRLQQQQCGCCGQKRNIITQYKEEGVEQHHYLPNINSTEEVMDEDAGHQCDLVRSALILHCELESASIKQSMGSVAYLRMAGCVMSKQKTNPSICLAPRA